MGELTFKSAGVGFREIDLSGPGELLPTGIPAGIIGTANQGPAFVPITMATFQDFIAKFGNTDGEKFGPIAVNEWLKHAQSVTYVRVLGAGDGKKRSTAGSNVGNVTNAGFVVGGRIPQQTGLVGENLNANTGPLGRTHFLGCFMSESIGSTIFSSAGIQKTPGNIAHPIIRGVLFAASGVVPMLSGTTGASTYSAKPASTLKATAVGPRGAVTGTVVMTSGRQEFVMLLNGHKGLDSSYPNVITASFDMRAPNYFANVFNQDPLKLESAGYMLYSHYDVHPTLANITGSGILAPTASFGVMNANTQQDLAFLTTGALDRNTGSAIAPNYENFEDRFRTPRTPYIVSQKFGGKQRNLFQVFALSDGQFANSKFKISIQNIAKSNVNTNLFGAFDLVVRSFNDTDDNPVILEQFRGLNLNPGSDRYVARVVGDQNVYFDFEKAEGSQKIVIEGNHPNKSNLIRVKMASELENGEVDDSALPVGFRGFYHLVTSGTTFLTTVRTHLTDIPGSSNNFEQNQSESIKRAIEPPVPFREKITLGTGAKEIIHSEFHWGVMFEHKTDLNETNKTLEKNATVEAFTKYFPTFMSTNLNVFIGENEGTSDSSGAIFDADRFNNNIFTLENVKVRTGSNGVADAKEWVSASYVRQGSIVPDADLKTRALNVETDFADATVRRFAKFSLFLQGGYDGVNIFNKDKTDLTNPAAKREMDDSNQGQDQGPTVMAYRKALEMMGNKTDVDVKLLSVPGLRHSIVTDRGISTTENRFDALYIMDIEERDTLNVVVTSSITQQISVDNTVTAFKNRALDSSFAAAYFPDVIIQDPATKTNLRCPPSVAVLGAFSLNDAVAFPWFAPAGFTRGALESVQEVAVRLNRNNLDALYEADINPLTSFPGSAGVVVWGQKTLKATQSALDRVNVRRLLIDIRRQVKEIGNRMLFEPNRESTLARFAGLVRPKLQRIQELSGIDKYKVNIDTSTTSEADVENNTIRGNIVLIPTRTAEFVQLDFVVTNTGNEI